MARMTLTLTFILATGLSTLAAQTTVVINPDRDTSLYGNEPSFSNGAGTRLFVGQTFQPGLRRALLHFDIRSAVPAGATIQTARFEATEDQGNAGSWRVLLHRLQADWGEAGSFAAGGQGGGTQAFMGDATWSHRFYDTALWTNPGGDFDAVASGSTLFQTTLQDDQLVIPSSPGLVADVQSWLDNPATNYGWILKTDEADAGDVSAFSSRESNTPPALVVTYTGGTAAANVSIGAGCTAGGGTPLELTASGLPTVPNASYSLTLSGGPTPTLSLVSIALAPLPSGLPLGGGCSLFFLPNTLVLSVATAGTLPLPIPNQTSLTGLALVAQGIVVNGTTLGTSNALVIQPGV